MLNKIHFSEYKAFSEDECLEIRPITILIGKNSSGKSSLCKLLPFFENATSGNMNSIFSLVNNGISLGSRYEDLFHNHETVNLRFKLEYDNSIGIAITYLMDGGDIWIYDYFAQNGNNKKQCQFDNKESDTTAFKGLFNQHVLDELNISKNDIQFKVDYIGPMRIDVPRTINFEGFNAYNTVGINGKDTYSILLNSYLQDKRLFTEVSQWMEENLEGQKLVFERNGISTGTYSICVQRNGVSVNIADVGQGLGQVLPVIVQSFMPCDNNISVIEQPALHLHPAAHANVAYRLAESTNMGKRYLIETHSENFILGIRKLISDPTSSLSPSDVVIYFINTCDDSAYLQKIEIDKNGELSDWPTGVFSESFDLMAEIMKNRK
jgi:predicted ATPase